MSNMRELSGHDAPEPRYGDEWAAIYICGDDTRYSPHGVAEKTVSIRGFADTAINVAVWQRYLFSAMADTFIWEGIQ